MLKGNKSKTMIITRKCWKEVGIVPAAASPSAQECLWGSYVLTNRKKGIAATIVILVILRKGNLLLNKFKNNLPTVCPNYLRAFWYSRTSFDFFAYEKPFAFNHKYWVLGIFWSHVLHIITILIWTYLLNSTLSIRY